MFNPDVLTFRDVADALYDFAAVSLLITLVWKSRGLYDDAKAFLTRSIRHMDVMEQGMQILLTNHAPHMETYLKTLAEREKTVGEADVRDNNKVASR